MKISKLFHWLYASVMLLPIFAIGVTCGYAMFNKNAFESKSDVIYDIQEKVSTNNFDNIINNTNAFLTLVASDDYNNLSVASYRVQFKNLTINNITYSEGIFTLGAYVGHVDGYFLTIYDVNFLYVQRYSINDFVGTYSFFLVRTTTNSPYYYANNMYGNFIEYFIITSSSYTLDNIFYYSVDKVTESPLFSWAYDSFLVAPFAYIVNLFSLPTNSPIVMLLSYWLAISIIWLVFDLVMYVPQLVHRWLDKGVLE